MKEKLVSFIASKWFGLIVGLIITVLAMWQEKALGDMTNAWALGLITSLFVGGLAEGFRIVIAKQYILDKHSVLFGRWNYRYDNHVYRLI